MIRKNQFVFCSALRRKDVFLRVICDPKLPFSNVHMRAWYSFVRLKKDFIKWGHFQIITWISTHSWRKKCSEKIKYVQKVLFFFLSTSSHCAMKRVHKQPEELLRHGMENKREEICFTPTHASRIGLCVSHVNSLRSLSSYLQFRADPCARRMSVRLNFLPIKIFFIPRLKENISMEFLEG